MKVEFLAPAEHEFREGIRYYAAFAPGLGDRYGYSWMRLTACLLSPVERGRGEAIKNGHRRIPTLATLNRLD